MMKMHLEYLCIISHLLQITDCYLPLGMTFPKEDRQSELRKKYLFHPCKCAPCSQDWPVTAEAPKGLGDVPEEKFR